MSVFYESQNVPLFDLEFDAPVGPTLCALALRDDPEMIPR